MNKQPRYYVLYQFLSFTRLVLLLLCYVTQTIVLNTPLLAPTPGFFGTGGGAMPSVSIDHCIKEPSAYPAYEAYAYGLEAQPMESLGSFCFQLQGC
jgi:hypothetical protein